MSPGLHEFINMTQMLVNNGFPNYLIDHRHSLHDPALKGHANKGKDACFKSLLAPAR